ncbi:MAG: hypothetical protein AB7V56_10595 [Candidatus Nitrosocosmicus sp.]|nr:hypothetical protein [Candidatus Nitrosocosmicus sp. SS]
MSIEDNYDDLNYINGTITIIIVIYDVDIENLFSGVFALTGFMLRGS